MVTSCRMLSVILCVGVIAAVPLHVWAEDEAKPAEAPKPADTEQKHCLLYEPGVVMLKGRLTHPVANWILELNNPACINGRDGQEKLYPSQEEVKKVFFQPRMNEQPDKYNEFTNKDVIVSGTLYHANVGVNAGDIMMMVSNIDLVKE